MEQTYEQYAKQQVLAIKAEIEKVEAEMAALTSDHGRTWYDLDPEDQALLNELISRHNHLMVVVDQY